MAWTYANWQTRTQSVAATAYSASSATIAMSGDQRDYVRVNDNVGVDAGANIGTYRVTQIAYAPNTTTLTVSPAPASAVVAGNVVFGPTAATRTNFLRSHHAEVAAKIAAAVSADGVSSNTDTLRQYLAAVGSDLAREERRRGGMYLRGQLRDA